MAGEATKTIGIRYERYLFRAISELFPLKDGARRLQPQAKHVRSHLSMQVYKTSL